MKVQNNKSHKLRYGSSRTRVRNSRPAPPLGAVALALSPALWAFLRKTVSEKGERLGQLTALSADLNEDVTECARADIFHEFPDQLP
jgi:hypothetical protein